VTCQSCGAENRVGGRFCDECGARLTRACSVCGNLVRPQARFCDECGAPAAPQGGAAGGQPPGRSVSARGDGQAPLSERRLVSVLFGDLVGFTVLSEHRDAEEVRELLTRYFETARRVVSRYGGVVEKFIGDAVMAVWGTPTAREDDAERAVRAALELTMAVSDLGAEVGNPGLQLRAGVVTGEAATTVGAEGQGMVAGDIVNTASRIQSAASPGTALVDDATQHLTEASVAYEDAGDHELKGKEGTVHLWRATRVLSGTGGEQRTAGLEAPLAGRDRELRLVKELYHTTAEERRARLLSVVGVAGIGKTRLTWELEKYLDGLADVDLWHRGRCLAYGEGVTYWALAEMVRRRAGILEGEEAASAAVKLRATIEEHAQDAEEGRWLEPRLAQLIGLEEGTTYDRDDLFAAWRRFFERLAATAPTVLVFEDVQWADSGLLDFIESLLDRSREHALFVVTLARPELAELRPTWGSGKRNFVSMYLEPLSADAMDTLLGGLVPGLPVEVRTRIRGRAEGVPLYAVETVRMLLDRGLLRREGERCVVTGEIGDLEVPQTLHALIAARLDQLGSVERGLIQHAAVLGQSFMRDALASLMNTDAEALDTLLAGLVAKEFLTVQTDPRSPERGQYAFLQALVHRVAYETLSKRERKARHLAAAHHLEIGWGKEADDIVEVIASHYVEAYRAAPADEDAPVIRASARHMLVRAGQRAASLAAVVEAERYYQRAAELSDDVLDRAELLERAGDMAGNAGKHDDAIALLEEAAQLFVSAGASHPAARVSARLGEVLWERGDREEAVRRMEGAFSELTGDDPDADLGALASMLARSHNLLGDPKKAAERVDTAMEIADLLGLPELASQALNTKSILLDAAGRRAESEALVRHALVIALENDLHVAAMRAYYNLADAVAARDRFDDAVTYSASGLALARRVGNFMWELRLLANVLTPLIVLGRWDDAVAYEAEMPQPGDIAAGTNVLIGYLPMSRLYVRRGDISTADRLIAAAAGTANSVDLQEAGSYAAAAGGLHAAHGEHREALEHGERAFVTVDVFGYAADWVVTGFEVALEAAFALDDLAAVERLIARSKGSRSLATSRRHQGHVMSYQARLAARRGASDAASAAYDTAAANFRDIGAQFDLAGTLLEHAELLDSLGRSESATAMAGEARTIFDRLAAVPSLTRLDAAFAARQKPADEGRSPAAALPA